MRWEFSTKKQEQWETLLTGLVSHWSSTGGCKRQGLKLWLASDDLWRPTFELLQCGHCGCVRKENISFFFFFLEGYFKRRFFFFKEGLLIHWRLSNSYTAISFWFCASIDSSFLLPSWIFLTMVRCCKFFFFLAFLSSDLNRENSLRFLKPDGSTAVYMVGWPIYLCRFWEVK